ncbi:trypsin-like peptidase domain-containing protein [Algoriphagus halophytocola]|uniref:Trypsin-like peptidase domain-containing protein n=1 Tax=Algoriphagus halophytocola TaxID=2991499 RepID=A0ABY6MPP3_9BACT|nr:MULTISPECIES: trypsin-like peptidase domain-containing protein [unclassified Algoriphagus]UZD24487.1 trypsin-like peptidase domain-containing protein [Algoriphagus sp. TR-M5]WBL41851.1 trypsin-like peptidase domain-containing protein [Algoriphagus sp. TR-M9]
MNNLIKTTGVSFLAGIAGAAAWSFLSFSEPVQPASFLPNSQQEVSFASQYEPPAPARTVPPISFVDASENSTESVVFIKNFSGTDPRRYSMFDYFFGGGGVPSQQVSTGSGVIISEDGYIVTNNHVIDRAETIEVVHKKQTYKATLVGTDKNTDIAVLKIEGENLPAIRKGNSRDLKIGEWVLAVGNPFNLTSTVTAGIVSAKERQINILGGDFPLESFIQTDAPINPGNSGGALVNVDGELVGINTAILSRTGSYTGYGFAVPVDIALKVANDLIQYGEVQKAIPGIEAVEITPELAEEMQINTLDGVIVTHVIKDGAAERAGLQRNDVITDLGDQRITGKGSFEEALSYYYPGDKLSVSFLRDGKPKMANLTLQNLEGGNGVIKREFYSSRILGAKLEAVNTIEKDKFGVDYGIKISGLTRGYLRELGLREGFILTQINRQPAQDPKQVGEYLEKYSGRLLLEGVASNGQPFLQSYTIR